VSRGFKYSSTLLYTLYYTTRTYTWRCQDQENNQCQDRSHPNRKKFRLL